MVSLSRFKAALTVAACLLLLAPSGALADERHAPGGDLSRAEKILAKLRRLDEAAAQDFRAYKSTFQELYPALFSEVADLREGDLKTDLTTAVFLYEAVYSAWHAGSAAVVYCDERQRDIYLKLCRENVGATRAQLIRARARLHSDWAAALVRDSRGARDGGTQAALFAMRAARKEDARLAARAVAALRRLGGQVNAYASLREFEEGVGVARVPFERFAADLATALEEVDRVLAELPRGPLHRQLRNARNAFREGASWWRKSSWGERRTVNVNSTPAPDPLKSLGLQAGAVNYTVVCDWRKAARAVEDAEGIITRLKSEAAEKIDGR